MKQSHTIDPDSHPTPPATIHLPPAAPVTAEELARRAALVARIHRIRESIGTLDIDVTRLHDADFYTLNPQEETVQQQSSDTKAAPGTLAAVELPPMTQATPEEIARRRALREEARRIQERIGPIEMNAVDLIDLDFYDEPDTT